MYIRDIMTTKVTTITSNTSIIKAKRVMNKNRLKRLPVVDDGKLVGMVTAQRLEKAAALESSSSDIWEFAYSLGSLYRTSVKKIMQKDLVMARPDTTVEEALALAQSKKVGALLVVDNGKLVGIVTTNDFFYRIVNKVLGVGESGRRIWVAGGGEGKAMEEIIATINKHSLEIITLHIIAAPKATKKDIVVHLDSDDESKFVAELREKGYKVELRRR